TTRVEDGPPAGVGASYVEGATGLLTGELAPREDAPARVGGLLRRALVAGQPGDHRVVPVGAEHPVRLVQDLQRCLPGRLTAFVVCVAPAQGEADRHSHDLLHPPLDRSCAGRCLLRAHSLAWSSALWRDSR